MTADGAAGPTGEVAHCYVGANAGEDAIVASVGSVTGSATTTWSDVPPPPECEEDGLDSIPLGGLLSGVLHGLDGALEDALPGVGDAVHGLSCDVVVPLDAVIGGRAGVFRPQLDSRSHRLETTSYSVCRLTRSGSRRFVVMA